MPVAAIAAGLLGGLSALTVLETLHVAAIGSPPTELAHLVALAHGAKIDSQRLALLIQVAALEAERLGRIRHPLVVPLQLRQNLFALKRIHALRQRPKVGY